MARLTFAAMSALAEQKNLVLHRNPDSSSFFRYSLSFAPTEYQKYNFHFQSDAGSIEWLKDLKEVQEFLNDDDRITTAGVNKVTRRDYDFIGT